MTLKAYLEKRTMLLAFFLIFIFCPTKAVLAQKKDWQETINAAKKEGTESDHISGLSPTH